MTVAAATVDSYLEGKDPGAAAMFRRFAELAAASGPAQVEPHRTIVHWKRKRVFAAAFVDGRRLELNIDLLREATHPTLLAAFPTTKRVITHRLRINDVSELDDSIAALLREAYEEVGPGTRAG